VRSLAAIGMNSKVDERADTDWRVRQAFIGMEPYELLIEDCRLNSADARKETFANEYE